MGEWREGSGIAVANRKMVGICAEASLGCEDVQCHEVICFGGK